MSRYSAIIDKILETIIRQGIALEVNSAGIRKGLHVPMPNAEYVKRYYDKGGRMVTVGSDAHRVADVGADGLHSVRYAAGYRIHRGMRFQKENSLYLFQSGKLYKLA